MILEDKRKDERGVVSVFVAIMFLAILAVLALINDGAAIRNGRRRLDNVAAQAARAGAQEINIQNLRTTGTLTLDPIKAKQTALDTLKRENIKGEVEILGDSVIVATQNNIELWGNRTTKISAQHIARITTNRNNDGEKNYD